MRYAGWRVLIHGGYSEADQRLISCRLMASSCMTREPRVHVPSAWPSAAKAKRQLDAQPRLTSPPLSDILRPFLAGHSRALWTPTGARDSRSICPLDPSLNTSSFFSPYHG